MSNYTKNLLERFLNEYEHVKNVVESSSSKEEVDIKLGRSYYSDGFIEINYGLGCYKVEETTDGFVLTRLVEVYNDNENFLGTYTYEEVIKELELERE